jgi:hypothetical protein
MLADMENIEKFKPNPRQMKTLTNFGKKQRKNEIL